MEFQLKKGYRPYEAYQYLEPGKDFKVIDWADWDWAGRNVLPLDSGRRGPVQGTAGKDALRQPSRSSGLHHTGYVYL